MALVSLWRISSQCVQKCPLSKRSLLEVFRNWTKVQQSRIHDKDQTPAVLVEVPPPWTNLGNPTNIPVSRMHIWIARGLHVEAAQTHRVITYFICIEYSMVVFSLASRPTNRSLLRFPRLPPDLRDASSRRVAGGKPDSFSLKGSPLQRLWQRSSRSGDPACSQT